MVIKLTLSASVVLYKLIIKLLFTEDQTERDLPFNIRYKLQRCLEMLQKDASYYEQERVKLVKKYGEQKDDGTITVSADNNSKFEEEAKVLLSKEVSHNFTKLTLDEVLKIDVSGIGMDETNLFMACMVEDQELVDDINAPIVNTNDGEADNTNTEAANN